MNRKPVIIKPTAPSPLWQRIMWLVIIYTASVLALALVAMLFRMLMTAAGMKSH